MTYNDILEHCKRQIKRFERLARLKNFEEQISLKREYEEHVMVAKLIEKSDKYKWHDLIKNPNDLPTSEDCKYLLCVKRWSNIADDWIDNDYVVSYFFSGKFDYEKNVYKKPIIKAWKCIEEYKGGE